MTNPKIYTSDSLQQKMLDDGLILPVMEMFYSIQGEGHNTGKAAFFIRIGGCDVGCDWCDVKESWNAAIHPLTPVDDIIEAVLAHPARSVVITGGEPLMYNLGPLCAKLKQYKVQIFLETSGTYPLSGVFDWICVSPKPQTPPRTDILQMADELKVIIHDFGDFNWAINNLSGIKTRCLLFLQPEWSRNQQMLPHIVDFVMKHPEWMISLQSHKFMNIP